ncbi:MAG: hypothetical protein LQ345_001857 [Seirophora villosa]|nr:MAG: hypothetical protein LQ345_001857 [Seirophora villosa]
MPPFIAGKRRRSPSPASSSLPSPAASSKKPGKKQSLFDAADERPTGSLQDNEHFVHALTGADSDTSLSDVSSIEFEDVTSQPAPKKQKRHHHAEDDEEVDWEDAVHDDRPTDGTPTNAVEPSGDLELTLDKGSGPASFINGQKKGPSKIERQIRIVTHCMHVQFLMFHNSLRSRFACDPVVQKVLVDQLSPTAKKEIETWKLASGQPPDENDGNSSQSSKPKKGKKVHDRKCENVRSQRDWGTPAERQEIGVANVSRGDPVCRLIKFLAAYWRKRFTIVAPGLRKQGYKPLARLEEEIASFKNDDHDPEEHGERIGDLDEFRGCARRCEGSRDIGAQLFVALLRGLGLEARLVASLQPVGFGWNKNEEANPKKKRAKNFSPQESHAKGERNSDRKTNGLDHKPKGREMRDHVVINGSKDIPIDLADSSSSDLTSIDEDDESIVDITPSIPRSRKPNMPYDRDLVFPTYWAEVVSPITQKVYPVDPFLLDPAVATKPEHLSAFEARGAKADKAKQVFAYVIAYSPDGTVKDVTTRYLKNHMWPGRTKGVRLPTEKIPIYNSKGKIKHHEEYDWFKTVMSGYTRPDGKRTTADDMEDATDLQAAKREKKDTSKEKEGTLQFYKTSAEYVLERHLRREEAIAPDAEPVRSFTAGKGDDRKDEPVFLRKDVLVCRTGESWHKEGRQIKADQTPLKMVPIRAVTLTRKREVEEAERDGGGEKVKQGLYAWDQTEWIVPAPIAGGVIPKNAYGNMDCFVPTMVPRGAAHVPLRATAKICKRLGVDFAEAVTGFEFGKQRAVPVITGVVVAAEHEALVRKEWEEDERERRIKEEGKREKVALGVWKKFLVGLRIVERVRGEYGAGGQAREESNPFTNRKKRGKTERADRPEVLDDDDDDDTGGGFLVDDNEPGGFPPSGGSDDSSADPSPPLLPTATPQKPHPPTTTTTTTTKRDAATRRKPKPKPKPSRAAPVEEEAEAAPQSRRSRRRRKSTRQVVRSRYFEDEDEKDSEDEE